MSEFTKGEWIILPEEDDKEYIRIRGTVLGGRYKIANVIDLKDHHDDSKWCEIERKESMANARLIAAAPELYNMLTDVFNALEQSPEYCLGDVKDTPDRQGWWIRDEMLYNISKVLNKVKSEP